MTMRSSILIRAGGLRAVTAFVSNIMLCLVLISSLLVMWLWPFGGEYHPTVEVRDDAHLFQPAPLVAEIKSMEFRRKVHVVVLTIPKVNEASLNEEVLAYVRHHGDGASKWISALRVRGCARWGLSWGSSGCCQVVFEASGADEAAESQGVQAQKGRQLRAGEGNLLRHVEVSQLLCVTAPTTGGPRSLLTATMHYPHLYS